MAQRKTVPILSLFVVLLLLIYFIFFFAKKNCLIRIFVFYTTKQSKESKVLTRDPFSHKEQHCHPKHT